MTIEQAKEKLNTSKAKGYGVIAAIQTEGGYITIEPDDGCAILYITETAKEMPGQPHKCSEYKFDNIEKAEIAAITYLTEKRYPSNSECQIIRSNKVEIPANRPKLSENEIKKDLEQMQDDYSSLSYNEVTGENAGYEVFGDEVMMYISDNSYDNNGAKLSYEYRMDTVGEAIKAIIDYMSQGKLPQAAKW